MYWIVALLLLSSLPVTQAQSDDDVINEILSREGQPITFYGHVFGHDRGSPMPMNTQYPWGEEDYSLGYAMPCGTPPPGPADNDCDNYDGNEEFFFTTAGFVQAKSWEEFEDNGEYAMLHNERGQTKDIYLDTNQPIQASLYMSADFHGWLAALCGVHCWNWDPGYFQDWGVEVEVWHLPLGEHGADASSAPNMVPIANKNAEGLTRIAYGITEIKDLVSFDETIPLDPLCGGPCSTVQEFTTDTPEVGGLTWDEEFVANGGVIPYTDDIVVEFEWSQFGGGEPDGQRYILSTPFAGTLWNLNGGEHYPNRVVLPVRNPLDVEVVFPKFVHDKLVILSLINTPWGSYDIDREATRLILTDANGREIPIDPATIDGGLDLSVSHAGHYLPIEGTWVWDYQAQGLDPGDYTITVEATNFQHSYTTSTSAAFTILSDGTGGETSTGRGGIGSFEENQVKEVDPGQVPDATLDSSSDEKDSPAAAPVLFLAALGALALLRRRLA